MTNIAIFLVFTQTTLVINFYIVIIWYITLYFHYINMDLKDFIQKFPAVTLEEINDNGGALKEDLMKIYTTLEDIGNEYDFDNLTPDEMTPLLNKVREVIDVMKK